MKEKLKSNKSNLSNLKRKIKPIKILVLIFITIFIFYWLASKISIVESFKIILKSNLIFILLSILLLLITLIIIIFRWLFIVRTLHSSAGFKDSLSSVMSACALNSVLPSKLGDFFKVYYFKDKGISKMVGAVFTERVFDIISMAFLLFIGSIILNKLIFIYISLLIMLIAFFTLSIFYVMRKKIRKFNNQLFSNILYSINWIIKRPTKAFVLFMFSLLIWFCSVMQIYFLFLAVSVYVDFVYFSAAIIISIFISLIPVTIAGMGTREGAIIYLFSSFAANENLLAAGLLFSFFRYWFLSILGLPFLYLTLHRK